jgi:hypothetical protein
MPLLAQRGSCRVERDPGEPVQPHELDQRPDLRLRAPQANRASLGAQTAGEHRKIKHQRHISENEVTQVDDHVGLRADGARERPAPSTLRGPILVPATAQSRRVFIELDDAVKPT